MTRELSKADADTRDWIQFRGVQTSVTHDATGVTFGMTQQGDRLVHAPRPVVDPDDPDPPDDAVARPVAAELVDRNPLVAWGVACPECGDVFETPQAASSHLSAHSEDDDDETDTDE